MTFEVSTDWDLIRSIMTLPDIWERISSDFSPTMSEYQPSRDERVFYMAVRDEAELIGIWMLVFHTPILCEVHTALLPTCGYRRARKAAKEMATWIWENSPAERIVTEVPQYNRAAGMLAIGAGMTRYGMNERSHKKHGQLWDVSLLGMSRPGGVQCQQPSQSH